MKIVMAFDSFKGSLTSLEAGRAAAAGAREVMPEAETVVIPVADGGEGTTAAVVEALGGHYESLMVSGPLGAPVLATFGVCGDTAVIETAAASGLTLVPENRRNPAKTTSCGTGQLIREALTQGCREFLIGLGGSATNDGGVGMLSALGWRFLDTNGKPIGPGGAELSRMVSIDASGVMPGLSEARFRVACDVTNPLTGPSGASRVFGPQKGADPDMVRQLDEALAHFARIVAPIVGKDYSVSPGSGAAGGLGFAFRAFLNGNLEPGIDMVLDAVGFDGLIRDADLIFTGEGRLDAQTVMGKAPAGVLTRAKRQGIPVIALGGCIDPSAIHKLTGAEFKALHAATPPDMPLDAALHPATAVENIRRAVKLAIGRSW